MPQFETLASDLRTATSGMAFVQDESLSERWSGIYERLEGSEDKVFANSLIYLLPLPPSICTVLHSDPLEESGRAAELLRELRRRKGLKPDPEPLSRYLDQL